MTLRNSVWEIVWKVIRHAAPLVWKIVWPGIQRFRDQWISDVLSKLKKELLSKLRKKRRRRR